MYAAFLVLAAAAALMTESFAAVGKELRAVEVYENILENLSPSERGTYGPSLENHINMLKRFVWPHSSPLGNEMEHIKSILFSNATSCAAPVAVFIGGGTASGKSSLDDVWMMPMNMSCGFSYIDPDDIMMEMNAWHGMVNAGDQCAAALLHANASAIAKSAYSDAIANNYNVVYDGTMSNMNGTLERLSMAASKGYRIYFFGAWASTALAAERAIIRANFTGRYVPLCVIVESHMSFSNNFMDYIRLLPENQLYDTNTPPQAVLIYKNSTVVDATRFQQFLAEANDTEKDVEGKLTATTLAAYEALNKECYTCGISQQPTSPLPPPTSSSQPIPPTTTAQISTSPSSAYSLQPVMGIIALAVGLVICVI
uniref:Zeta toxin domain-containing protein n=1 Tax=Plectus sambesii TaxID=2011161 RepID=A0A914VIU9_9BILA